MSDFSVVQNLPDVDFVTTSVDDLLSEGISAYQNKYYELTGATKTVQPGDDVYILLYAQALRDSSILQSINHGARMNLLKYSVGNFLAQIAANTGNTRSASKAAVTTVQFSAVSPQASAVTIPQGTRVTAGDGIFFATDAEAVIQIGNTAVATAVTCTEAGAAGNGYIPGQLSILVDAVPLIASVANTETTQGGSDTESDLSLAGKIFASPSGYSVAGPELAYDYFARAFSPAIIDTKPIRYAPGVVYQYILLAGGELPNETLLTELEEYTEKYRPLTDNYNALAPDVVNYDVTLTYYIDAVNTAQASTIRAAVEAAVIAFTNWTKAKLGRGVIPDELTALVKAAGARRAVITAPVYTAVPSTSVAIAGTVTLTDGGLE